jgi:hypothetical protein
VPWTFTADVWEHDGPAAWYFLSLPGDVSDAIEVEHGDRAAGFGSVRVEVTVGATTWRTSVFPDRPRETYVLPVKKAVRLAEGIDDGSRVEVRLAVVT